MNQPVASPNEKSFFITFEGGEGVGKSTQIMRLQERLQKISLPVTVSREPGGTPGAEAVRHVVLDKAAAEPFGPEMEALLFAAARNDHVEQVIKPALARGEIVIIDRFMDSTRVYQGASSNLNPEFVNTLERVAIHGTIPNLTLILDLDPKIGMERVGKRRPADVDVDRFERENLNSHSKRRAAFLKIAEQEPGRCVVIDAANDINSVERAIWDATTKALMKANIIQRKTKPKQTK